MVVNSLILRNILMVHNTLVIKEYNWHHFGFAMHLGTLLPVTMMKSISTVMNAALFWGHNHRPMSPITCDDISFMKYLSVSGHSHKSEVTDKQFFIPVSAVMKWTWLGYSFQNLQLKCLMWDTRNSYISSHLKNGQSSVTSHRIMQWNNQFISSTSWRVSMMLVTFCSYQALFKTVEPHIHTQHVPHIHTQYTVLSDINELICNKNTLTLNADHKWLKEWNKL